MSNKILSLDNGTDLLEVSDCAFLCSASYEDRTFTVASEIHTVKYGAIFAALDCCSLIQKNAESLSRKLPHSEIVPTMIGDPLFTANAMTKIIDKLKRDNIKRIIVDVTTFTHEQLLILLKLLFVSRDAFEKITCAYASAEDYSCEQQKEKKWLSKGCKEIRSVLGYPGLLVPGRPTALIVLVGFEHERASRVIAEMDPELLFLGKGIPAETTNDSHRIPMEYFQKLLANLCATRGEVQEFHFSSKNQEQTFLALEKVIKETPEYNHIIVPMNTKISTLAVARLALHNDKIQVCYAEPETYNIASYSKPGNTISTWDLTFFN